MSISKVVLDLKVRKDPPRQGVKAFQAEVEPQAAFGGQGLYLRLSNFLGLGSDGHRARVLVENIEAFIRHELEQGNRLDFGLISFFPKLSAALPARDADPTESGLFVRGGVKARKALAAPLSDRLVAKNPVAGDPLWIGSVLNERRDAYDIVGAGDSLSITCAYVSVNPTRPDEGVWLEKQIKRRGQKHVPLVRAEILVPDVVGQIRCRFPEVPPHGKYNLVIGTRGSNTDAYKLRYVRHAVRVV